MTKKTDVLDKLKGTDRRSIGESVAVVIEVLADTSLFGGVFEGMLADDPVMRMRSADAVEKISARRPDLLQHHKEELLGPVAAIKQQEVRWHVAQMLPRLDLDPVEVQAAVGILKDYLQDRSKIVRTFALQGLADLTRKDPDLRPQVIALVEAAVKDGSPAEQSRGKRLRHQLQTKTQKRR